MDVDGPVAKKSRLTKTGDHRPTAVTVCQQNIVAPEKHGDPFHLGLPAQKIWWRTFPVQAEALRHVEVYSSNNLHVFSYEISPTDGKRRYVAASYDHFWQVYSRTKEEKRNYYEVIDQEKPVKLYFDLEFSKELNPENDPEIMIQQLIDQISKKLEEIFGERFSPLSYIQLDSSTETKFSQHLIFQNVIFRSYEHCGCFVNLLCDDILKNTATNPSLQCLGIKAPDPRTKELITTLFIDRGVYTKNRSFRIYLSTKMGKKRPLLLDPKSPVKGVDQKETFLLSLVNNISDLETKKVLEMILETEKIKDKDAKAAPRETLFRPSRCGDPPSATGMSVSPYPIVDDFIQKVISSNGCHGVIRNWQFFKDSFTIVYGIGGDYRYCARIGRHHKSNNVTFVVKPAGGIYYQKCLDQECRALSFRSGDYRLPFILEDPNHPNIPHIETGDLAVKPSAIPRTEPSLHTNGNVVEKTSLNKDTVAREIRPNFDDVDSHRTNGAILPAEPEISGPLVPRGTNSRISNVQLDIPNPIPVVARSTGLGAAGPSAVSRNSVVNNGNLVDPIARSSVVNVALTAPNPTAPIARNTNTNANLAKTDSSNPLSFCSIM